MKFLLTVILSALTVSPKLSAEQEVSVSYSYDLSAYGNTIQRIILTIDSIIETSFRVSILEPNIDIRPRDINLSTDAHVGYLSISGDNAISYKLTRSIDELAEFFFADPSPSDGNYIGSVLYESSYWNEFVGAADFYADYTHPYYIGYVDGPYIWEKSQSVTIRPKSQYLAYIGEEYAVWFKLNWIQQTDGLILVSVEDHEIVTAESKDSIRLPTFTQNVNLNAIDPIDIIYSNNFCTVSGSASTVGTFIIQQSFDLENWGNVSGYSLNYPGKITFSTTLPTVNANVVWEIPADDTTHPNYIEGDPYITLDEPLVQVQPIPKAFFRVIHQTL